MASVAALVSHGHNGAVGPLDLLWTGKAVQLGVGGLHLAQGRLPVGRHGGLSAGRRGGGDPRHPGLGHLALHRHRLDAGHRRRRGADAVASRHDSRAVALAAVFGVTFLAGSVFNLYSQPQDPQMQINVMAWLTPGWMLVLLAAEKRWGRRGPRGAGRPHRDAVRLQRLEPGAAARPRRQMAAGDRAPRKGGRSGAHGVRAARFRLGDDLCLAALGTGGAGDRRRWARRRRPLPKFKWIGFTGQVLRHPEWTTEAHVADLRRQIDRALALGYDVLVARLWPMEQKQLETETGMVADSPRLAALHRMLRTDYTATLAFDDPVGRAVPPAPARAGPLTKALPWPAGCGARRGRPSAPSRRWRPRCRRAAARPRPAAWPACAPRARPAPAPRRRRRPACELFTKATYLAMSAGKKPAGSNTLGST